MLSQANLNCSKNHQEREIPEGPAINREAETRKSQQNSRVFWSALVVLGVPLATLGVAYDAVFVNPTPEIMALRGRNVSALVDSSLGKDATHADPVEKEIRHNYEQMIEAMSAQDAEGLLHFISKDMDLRARRSNEPWRDALRGFLENGDKTSNPNGVSPFVPESVHLVHFERGIADANNNITEMQVAYQVEDSASFTNYRDIWTKEDGTWKIKTYTKESEFKKAEAEQAIREAYRKMDHASADAAETFVGFLTEKYTYVTKTGVTIFEPELKESLEQFVKRHRWSERRTQFDSGRFEGDGKYIAARSVRVPLKHNREVVAAYQDTWERQGDTWRLAQTTVQDQATQLNEREREKPRLIAAIQRTNDADIAAKRAVSAEPLYNAYTGKALNDQLAMIQALQSKRCYEATRLQDQRFERFSISGDTASVRVVEVWTTQVFSSLTGQSWPSTTSSVPQTYHLIRKGGEWIVDDVAFDKY